MHFVIFSTNLHLSDKLYLGQRAGVCTNSDRRPLRRPARMTHWDFLKIGNFASFHQFLHIKG